MKQTRNEETMKLALEGKKIVSLFFFCLTTIRNSLKIQVFEIFVVSNMMKKKGEK